jgi:DinB superfamily
MDDFWKTVLCQQFGAAIDMLENAMRACPDDLWSNTEEKPAWVKKSVVGFWYVVYQTLFWLDFYLSDSEQGFVPPAPFTLDELDPAGLLPERPYTKDELQRYLDHGREKCRAAIEALTDERARALRRLSSGEVNGAELLLYNLRHVQHHAAQLNLLLRQTIDSVPAWVAKTRS